MKAREEVEWMRNHFKEMIQISEQKFRENEERLSKTNNPVRSKDRELAEMITAFYGAFWQVFLIESALFEATLTLAGETEYYEKLREQLRFLVKDRYAIEYLIGLFGGPIGQGNGGE
jgi:hypothetical protein